MALVSIKGISLSFGSGPILDTIDLNIEPGDRACLVGRNGTGKSSLLKILHGTQAPDSGEILASKDTRTAYLPQDVPGDIAGSVEAIASSWAKTSRDTESDWESEHIVRRILSHLSLDAHAQFTELSGGQKRRVLLARALACEPDLLLLDEPTNHLDIDSICWLETFILRHCKTLLFVTHDRAFLRRVANRIIDLDRGLLADWSCDYDTFLQRKADLLHDEQVRQAIFDKKLSKEETWIRQGIKARRTRNEGRVRQLMTMREERQQRRGTEGTARMTVQQAQRSGNKVIETKALSFSYDQQPPIIQNLDTRVMRGDRVGIVGPNGSGKTTLLKLFTQELAPESGTLILGTNLEPAYFDQHRAVLNNDKTVAENVDQGLDSVTIDGKKRHVIGYLQDFLFTPDRARTPVHVLSGGERNRLLLALLFAQPSNLLIMDEPTNDLDAETLELLEDQLMNYKGTLLMVSHDRAFLDNVVTSILALEGNGLVKEYLGGYQEYANARITKTPATAPATKRTMSKPTTKKGFGFNENREFNALPRKIEKLEEAQKSLHDRMVAPDYYKTAPSQIAADTQTAAELTDSINHAYARWDTLDALRNE